ncbi:hypothetical protein pb186bvf_007237 [Paramecium bursaria]
MQQEFGFYYFFKYEKESIEFRNFQLQTLQYNHFDDLIYYYYLERDSFVRLDYLMEQSLRERMNVSLENLSKMINQVLEYAKEIRLNTDIQANLDLTLTYIKIENNMKRLQQKQTFQLNFQVLFLEYDYLQQDFKKQQELYYQQIYTRQKFYQISPSAQVNFSDLFSCLGKRKKQVFQYSLLTDFLLNNFEDYYRYNIKYFPEKCNKILVNLRSDKQIKKQDQFSLLLLNDIDRILTLPDKEIEMYISYLKLMSQFYQQINKFPVLKSQIYNYLQQMQKALQINDKLLNLDYIYSMIMKDCILKTVKTDFKNKQIAGEFLREHKDQLNNIIFMILNDAIMNL